MIIIFLYLVKEGLSFLQLFLELPETIWGLRKVLYTKKSPKNAESINTHTSANFFARYISRKNVTPSISGYGFRNFWTFFSI